MKKYIVLLVASSFMASCGEPNHYDTHVGQKPKKAQDDRHDTIQGRAQHPDSIGVTDTTNIGVGDTSLLKTPH